MKQNLTPGSETDSALNFRWATAEDRGRLIPVINSAYSVEVFFEGTRTDEPRLAEMMERGRILMAEDASGELLASIYTELRGSSGYLGMLAVDPAHQRSGIGRRLMEAAEDSFRQQGCQAAEIVVLNHRTELPPIYRRFGYVETGTEEFHSTRAMKPGVECHCIVMSKQL